MNGKSYGFIFRHFSIPGILISLAIGVTGALSYGLIIVFSFFLGIIFIGCAILISQISNRQQIALGIAIGLWIFFEIIYDLITLGTTLYFSTSLLKYSLIVSLIGNPVDIVRVISLLAVGGAEFFGPGGTTLLKLAGSEWLAMLYGLVGLFIWMIIPLFISIKIFSKQNL